MINIKTTSKKPYALDGLWPIRHIVTTLVRAEKALTISEFKYQHSPAGDIFRIKLHETGEESSDREANEWIIGWGLSQLGPDQIEEIDGTHYKLKVPHEEIRWSGRPVYLIEDEILVWSEGSEPFSQLNGPFHENIRVKEPEDDLAELRESMREYGWVKQFPALKDERGVVLVGHRRLKVAEELGLTPVFEIIDIGRGPQADAERLRIAIVSNIGFRPMSKKSRERLARYLYGEKEWTIAKIASALNVGTTTTFRDVEPVISSRIRELPPEQIAEIIHRRFILDQTIQNIYEEMELTRYAVAKVINAEKDRRAQQQKPAVVDDEEPKTTEAPEPAVVDDEEPKTTEVPIVREPQAPIADALPTPTYAEHECVCRICGERMKR